MKTQILQEQSLAFFQLVGHFFRSQTDTIRGKANIATASKLFIQKHAQAFCCRLQAHLCIELSLWTPQMRSQDQPRAFAQGILDCGQGFADARIVRNTAIFRERDIEVHAHENPMSFKMQVLYGKLCHVFLSCNRHYRPFFAMKWIRSRTRQEYPHSLSYQAITFTQLPATTRVSGESTMEERSSPR